MIHSVTKAIRGAGQRTFSRGPWHASKWVWHHVYERFQERILRVDTARFDDWKGVIGDDSCHDYEPLAYRCIKKALALIESTPKDVFLDYGSGKGRAVLVAARQPFRRVIGVELLEKLCEIARANIERTRGKLICQRVEVIAADATEFAVPNDVTVIYLYNPFWGDVMTDVQQQILESLRRAPRMLTIINLIPSQQVDAFSKLNWLSCQMERTELWENVDCVIYQHLPNSNSTP